MWLRLERGGARGAVRVSGELERRPHGAGGGLRRLDGEGGGRGWAVVGGEVERGEEKGSLGVALAFELHRWW